MAENKLQYVGYSTAQVNILQSFLVLLCTLTLALVGFFIISKAVATDHIHQMLADRDAPFICC